MNLILDGYDENFRIVSLALNNPVKQDLIEDKLDFLFVEDDKVILYPDEKVFFQNAKKIEMLRDRSNYDVFELWPNGYLQERYNDKSLDNYFFITGKCNSNCIMCPSPDFSRKSTGKICINDLIMIAKHIPADAPHLTITGGEPFMAGDGIFKLISFAKDKFEQTEFLILTNGRIFSVDKYAQKLKETIPNHCIVAIPLHGSKPEIHDKITRAKNSFTQTIIGIRHLLRLRIRIELRLVVCRANMSDFSNIANLIIDKLPGIEYVSVMAMEMTGNARINKEEIWIPYSDAFIVVSEAIDILLSNGIDVKLYNFPLCTISNKYWTICEKSINPNKVRYAEKCNLCSFKSECGGVFAGTYNLEKEELKPIQ